MSEIATSTSPAATPAVGSAPKPWRKLVAVAVLLGGVALVASTMAEGHKEPVSIHVDLPNAVTGLRMDVHREQRLAEHLEWSYGSQPPGSQDATLELPAGEYVLLLTALGGARPPAEPLKAELHVLKGEPARLVLQLR